MNTLQVLKTATGENMILDGKDYTIGRALGIILSQTKSGDPLRSYLLAGKFSTQETVELDASDKDFVVSVLKTADFFPVIVGQLLEIIK